MANEEAIASGARSRQGEGGRRRGRPEAPAWPSARRRLSRAVQAPLSSLWHIMTGACFAAKDGRL